LLGLILAFFFLKNRRIIYILDNTFRPDSDLDVLITFSLDADWSLFDHVQMQQELANIQEGRSHKEMAAWDMINLLASSSKSDPLAATRGHLENYLTGE
jgi:hypothetical protein